MSKNPNGGLGKRSTNKEWGRKARKAEDHERGIRSSAKAEVISEQLDEGGAL